jgi:predicted small secreted protein
MTKILKISCAVIALGTLVACNTINGIGRDLGNAGDAIADASR